MKKRRIFKWILYVLLLLIAFILQTTVLSGFRFMGVHLNLVPIVVASVAMFEGVVGGAGFGFISGLLCDALIPPSEAFFTLYLMLIGLLIGRMCDVYFRKRLFTAIIWAFIALALQGLLYFAVFYLIAGRAGAEAIITVGLPEAVFSLIFVPFIYLPARGIYRKFGENNL